MTAETLEMIEGSQLTVLYSELEMQTEPAMIALIENEIAKRENDQMIERLDKAVQKGIVKTRVACIFFCINYLDNIGKTSLPFTTIEHISKLYYDGKLID